MKYPSMLLLSQATTLQPTADPTAAAKAPTSQPCDDGKHGCDKNAGGACVKDAKVSPPWRCTCKSGYMCTAGCSISTAHKGQTCTPQPTASVDAHSSRVDTMEGSGAAVSPPNEALQLRGSLQRRGRRRRVQQHGCRSNQYLYTGPPQTGATDHQNRATPFVPRRVPGGSPLPPPAAAVAIAQLGSHMQHRSA